jgi:release factor glutamine methyltransferase
MEEGKPIEYRTNSYTFLGRQFYIDDRAYVPNPETEILVQYAISRLSPHDVIVDVGTGSGNIAVSIALEIPTSKIYAVDIDSKALDVAQRNIEKYKTHNIVLKQGHYVDNIDTSNPALVVADLPWGDDDHLLESSGVERHSYMPKIALFHPGGIMGAYLELIESILKRGWETTLLFESGVMTEQEVLSLIPEGLEREYIPFRNYSITKVIFSGKKIKTEHLPYFDWSG